MRFGLIIRGQYPQGDDMRVRLREDLEAAKFAEQLGYDLIGKGSLLTVRIRFSISSRFHICAKCGDDRAQIAAVPVGRCCHCTARCTWRKNSRRWMSCATAS